MRLPRILSSSLPLILALSACQAKEPPPAPAAATGVEIVPAPPALPPLEPGPDGKVRLSEAAWRERLTPGQYRILRASGTELACSGAYWKTDGKKGAYHCGACGFALFDSASKYDSGTGWPSFSRPISPARVISRTDTSHGMVRTEILCFRCESHLGHSFEDGPPPDGIRYCMNSLALVFVPEAETPPGAAK